MENKKGMFTGFTKVFNFTAAQNVKGKGFKVSTIIIALAAAVIFAAISIIQAAVQIGGDKSDGGDDINSIIDLQDKFDMDIYYVNNSNIADEVIEGITSAEAFEKITVIKVEKDSAGSWKDNPNELLKGNNNAVLMDIEESDERINIEYYLPYGTELSKDDTDTVGTAFQKYFDFVRVNQIENMDGLHMELYMSDVHTDTLIAGEKPDELGVFIAKLIVPMIFSLVLYMMILLYGQNITKVVVSEKSSKLMETLLTSVKPYAVIAGKIIAVSGIAILQMFIWCASGIAGFMIGERIAQSINPGYINYVSEIMDIIGSSSDAFSVGAVIVAVLTVVLGFFAYSVLAGLVAAMVDKMEDISSVMGLFQIPVVVGFMGAYFTSMSENKVLGTIVQYFPVTSPFYTPAALVVGTVNGDVTVIQGIISLLILAAVTFALILVTGRVYKGKLFNRH